MDNYLKKKKAIIVISEKEYARNYLTTKALDDLRKEFECRFIFSFKLAEINFNIEESINYYSGLSNEYYYNKINKLLMWKYRYKSKSFLYRIKREIAIGFSDLKRPKRLFLKFYEIFYYSILTKPLFFDVFLKYLKTKLIINRELLSTIIKFCPDIVIFPTSAINPVGYDLVEICKLKGIKTFFLVDNWDNLSSKNIMWNKPDYVSVWGFQSSIHARKIQDFENSSIFILGTPRFDRYFEIRKTNLNSYFDFNYILYVGTVRDIDEARVLCILDNIISKNKAIFFNTKIVYRPHPWRSSRDSIIDKNLKNIIVDPQVKENYLSKNSSDEFQPNLDYYPSLIKNAEFVIGGLTSMLIESLIFYKNFIALVNENKKSMVSPSKLYKNYTHFENLDCVSAIKFCDNLQNLEEIILCTWINRLNVNQTELDKQRQYFYHYDGSSYSLNLLKYTKLITSSSQILSIESD